MPSFERFDAQSALNFLISQLTYLEREAYKIQYPSVDYPELVTVDSSAPEWTPSVTYFTQDYVGEARWFNSNALDVPHTELLRDKGATNIDLAAAGYRYNLQEIAQAQALGINLNAEKAVAAREVAEQFVDKVVKFGDSGKGYTGLINSASVTAATATADGTGSSALWTTKTSTQILRDINNVLMNQYTGTLRIEISDTLLLPPAQYTYLMSTPFNTTTDSTTLMEWIRRTNAYTVQTGNPLTVKSILNLDTSGAGGTARMVAYRNDPSIVKFYMPMPFRWLQPMQVGPLIFEAAGIMRMGGVDFRRPKSATYLDGI